MMHEHTLAAELTAGQYDLLVRFGGVAGDHQGLAKAYQQVAAYHLDVMSRMVNDKTVTDETSYRMRVVAELQDRLEHLLLIERYVSEGEFGKAVEVAEGYEALHRVRGESFDKQQRRLDAITGQLEHIRGQGDGDESVEPDKPQTEILSTLRAIRDRVGRDTESEGRTASPAQVMDGITKAMSVLRHTATDDMLQTLPELRKHSHATLTDGKAFQNVDNARYNLDVEPLRLGVARNEGFERFLGRRVAATSGALDDSEPSEADLPDDSGTSRSDGLSADRQERYHVDVSSERGYMALACAQAVAPDGQGVGTGLLSTLADASVSDDPVNRVYSQLYARRGDEVDAQTWAVSAFAFQGNAAYTVPSTNWAFLRRKEVGSSADLLSTSSRRRMSLPTTATGTQDAAANAILSEMRAKGVIGQGDLDDANGGTTETTPRETGSDVEPWQERFRPVWRGLKQWVLRLICFPVGLYDGAYRAFQELTARPDEDVKMGHLTGPDRENRFPVFSFLVSKLGVDRVDEHGVASEVSMDGVISSTDWVTDYKQDRLDRKHEDLRKEYPLYGIMHFISYWLVKGIANILQAIFVTPIRAAIEGARDAWTFIACLVRNQANMRASMAEHDVGTGEEARHSVPLDAETPAVIDCNPSYHQQHDFVFDNLVDGILMQPMHVFGRMYSNRQFQALMNTVGFVFALPLAFNLLPPVVESWILTLGKAMVDSGAQLAGSTTAANLIMLVTDGVNGKNSLIAQGIDKMLKEPDKVLAFTGLVAGATAAAPFVPGLWPMISSEAGTAPAIATVIVYAKGGLVIYHGVEGHEQVMELDEATAADWRTKLEGEQPLAFDVENPIEAKYHTLSSVWDTQSPINAGKRWLGLTDIAANLAREDALYSHFVSEHKLFRNSVNDRAFVRMFTVVLAIPWHVVKITLLSLTACATGLYQFATGKKAQHRFIMALLRRQNYLFMFDAVRLGMEVGVLTGRFLYQTMHGLLTILSHLHILISWPIDAIGNRLSRNWQNACGRLMTRIYNAIKLNLLERPAAWLGRVTRYQSLVDSLDTTVQRRAGEPDAITHAKLTTAEAMLERESSGLGEGDDEESRLSHDGGLHREEEHHGSGSECESPPPSLPDEIQPGGRDGSDPLSAAALRVQIARVSRDGGGDGVLLSAEQQQQLLGGGGGGSSVVGKGSGPRTSYERQSGGGGGARSTTAPTASDGVPLDGPTEEEPRLRERFGSTDSQESQEGGGLGAFVRTIIGDDGRDSFDSEDGCDPERDGRGESQDCTVS